MRLIRRHHGRRSQRSQIMYLIPVVIIFLLLQACGKKGPPTLASYEKPPAPMRLTASQKEDKIILSWSYPPERERTISGFLVLRSSGTGFKKIARVEGSLRSFIDSDVKKGSTYEYKVASQNVDILSPVSNGVTVTLVTSPRPPGTISWGINGNSLVLSWEKTGAGILYNVYKTHSKDTDTNVPENISPLSEPTFRDVLPLDRPVFYRLRSLLRNGITAEGPASAEVTVTPDDLLPGPPEEVRYFAAADRVYLYWKETDMSWINGFRVYRKFASEKDYILIGETQIPSFVDRESPHQRRSYRITALGPSREGSPAEIHGVGFAPD